MRSLRLAAALAWHNVRRRPCQAALLLVTLTIATGTLGVGMSLSGSADGPWDRVWPRTNGFHVSAIFYTDRDAPRGDLRLAPADRRFAELSRAPEVVAVGGPWVHLYGRLMVSGVTED